jgi:hypothetical protein
MLVCGGDGAALHDGEVEAAVFGTGDGESMTTCTQHFTLIQDKKV